MEKDNLIRDLNTSLEAVYELSQCHAELKSIQEKVDALIAKSKKIGSKAARILMCIWFIAFVVILSYTLSPLMQRGVGDFGLILYAAALFIIPTFVLIYLIGKRLKVKEEAFLNEHLPPLQQELSNKQQTLDQLCKSEKVEVLLKTVPEDYATIDAVEYLLTVLSNQRADTLKEALNLYENHRNQVQLMEAQGKMIDLAEKNIAISQEIASGQNQIIAGQNQIIAVQMRQLQASTKLIEKTKRVSRQVRFSNALNVINTVKHWSDGKSD